MARSSIVLLLAIGALVSETTCHDNYNENQNSNIFGRRGSGSSGPGPKVRQGGEGPAGASDLSDKTSNEVANAAEQTVQELSELVSADDLPVVREKIMDLAAKITQIVINSGAKAPSQKGVPKRPHGHAKGPGGSNKNANYNANFYGPGGDAPLTDQPSPADQADQPSPSRRSNMNKNNNANVFGASYPKADYDEAVVVRPALVAVEPDYDMELEYSRRSAGDNVNSNANSNYFRRNNVNKNSNWNDFRRSNSNSNSNANMFDGAYRNLYRRNNYNSNSNANIFGRRSNTNLNQNTNAFGA